MTPMTVPPDPEEPAALPVDGAADRAALARLEAVSAELGRRGLLPRMVVADLCGEPELRLVVDGPRAPAEVQVLGPCAAAPLEERWYAVRLCRNERITWQGPQRSCPAAALVEFVEALLDQDPAAATARYDVLG